MTQPDTSGFRATVLAATRFAQQLLESFLNGMTPRWTREQSDKFLQALQVTLALYRQKCMQRDTLVEVLVPDRITAELFAADEAWQTAKLHSVVRLPTDEVGDRPTIAAFAVTYSLEYAAPTIADNTADAVPPAAVPAVAEMQPDDAAMHEAKELLDSILAGTVTDGEAAALHTAWVQRTDLGITVRTQLYTAWQASLAWFLAHKVPFTGYLGYEAHKLLNME